MDPSINSSDAPDRDISAEPCSYRTNSRPRPFDGDQSSARKRRRTSPSPSSSTQTATSPSRCTETSDMDDQPSSSSAHPASPAMGGDNSPLPLPPQTPEGLPENEQPSEPPSNGVATISLRKMPQDGAHSPDSYSPSPADRASDDGQAGWTKQTENGVGSTPEHVTSADEASPDAQSPSDAHHGGDEAMIDPDFDPVKDFPYSEPGDNPKDSVDRFATYFNDCRVVEIEILQPLSDWVHKTLTFLHGLPHDEVLRLLVRTQEFWRCFPNLIFVLSKRSKRTGWDERTCEQLELLCAGFGRMVAAFVNIDCRTLEAHSDDHWTTLDQPPLLLSSFHLVVLGRIRCREQPDDDSSLGKSWGNMVTRTIYRALNNALSDGLRSALSLIRHQVALRSAFPDMLITAAGLAVAANYSADEAAASLVGPVAVVQADEAKAILATAQEIYDLLDAAFVHDIDEHIDHFKSDLVFLLEMSLEGLLRALIVGHGHHPCRLVDAHREAYDEMPSRDRIEAIVEEWRTERLSKLIMASNNMDLRISLIGALSRRLIGCWQRFSQQPHGKAIQNCLAKRLTDLGIIDYFLGLKCRPELVKHCGSIVSFLGITRNFTTTQADLAWQTMRTAEDPRAVEALLGVLSHLSEMLDVDIAIHFCEKLRELPLEDFTAPVRLFSGIVFRTLATHFRADAALPANYSLFSLCFRLLQESSTTGAGSQVAFPEVHAMAVEYFQNLLSLGLDPDIRDTLLITCKDDLEAGFSQTTLGSLWCLLTTLPIGSAAGPDLRRLATDFGLPRLLVQELVAAARASRATHSSSVLQGPANVPRACLLSKFLIFTPAYFDAQTGSDLVDALVGLQAATQEDRDTGWKIFVEVSSATTDGPPNPFIDRLFTEFLPSLPDHCLSEGTLPLINHNLNRRMKDEPDGLDDPSSTLAQGVEQLWRLILNITNNGVARTAIDMLVRDVFLESKLVCEFPEYRALALHRRLVQRCLLQMQTAAESLQHRDSHASPNGVDTAMNTQSCDTQQSHCAGARLFSRSLRILQVFYRAHKASGRFALTHLRSFAEAPASPAHGQPANLKYQHFDDANQSDVMSLDIGVDNGVAALLRLIRDATGYEDFRVYYKGKSLYLVQGDDEKSLGELGICDGFLLVKKEQSQQTEVVSVVKRGSTVLEAEILAHFHRLWRYLSMGDEIADLVLELLIELPMHVETSSMLSSAETPYSQALFKGEPYKTRYAIYGLGDFLNSQAIRCRGLGNAADAAGGGDAGDAGPPAQVFTRCESIMVQAINDPDVLNLTDPSRIVVDTNTSLVRLYLQLLKAVAGRSGILGRLRITPPVARLVQILSTANANKLRDLGKVAFEALLLSSVMDMNAWELFKIQAMEQHLFENLLLQAEDDMDRIGAAEILRQRLTLQGMPIEAQLAVSANTMHSFFWGQLSALMLRARDNYPDHCQAFFALVNCLVRHLYSVESPELHASEFLQRCFQFLMTHETKEELGHSSSCDLALKHFVPVVNFLWENDQALRQESNVPAGFATTIFQQLLFPAARSYQTEDVPRRVLTKNTRGALYKLLYNLAASRPAVVPQLRQDLQSVVPYHQLADEEDPYDYELPPSFDRSMAVRAPCGYAGLRNLGNTCYLNSLMTQLFMNVSFREFMIRSTIQDDSSQNLLLQTQKVFAYLQDTYQKFVDPTLMVDCIKTYENSAIDVGVQMDVDEFFNLLFDRWEGQFCSAGERQAFRRFYGGQLVHQIKSRECTHISERMEPFSAIQCDIMGHKNLHGSLKAYVEGEPMAGDNKYKCTSCDAHVDAVRRTCLKELPDNLIFHLKRFDFNLATYERRKINDRFEFPRKINMREYTFDHVTHETPSEDEATDWFELTGILVHTGTAESGHYYSFLREQRRDQAIPSWFEFNDENVQPWNPDDMEEATFGGPFIEHAEDTTLKSHSAYMLFYQRSSPKTQIGEGARTKVHDEPAKAILPVDLSDAIRNDNTNLLRRHCLFDPDHVEFVLDIYQLSVPESRQCTEDHAAEDGAMSMMLSHFDQVILRTRGLPFLERYRHILRRTMSNCGKCAASFISYFHKRPGALQHVLQLNTDADVRKHCAELYIHACRVARSKEPKTYGLWDPAYEHPVELEGTLLLQLTESFEMLFRASHRLVRSWNEVYRLIKQFALLGKLETAVLLQFDWLHKAAQITAADPRNEMTPDRLRKTLANIRQRRKRDPSYACVIELIDHLLNAVTPQCDDLEVCASEERLAIFASQPNEKLPWSHSEQHSLLSNASTWFIRRLLDVNESPQATENIIVRLAQNKPHGEAALFKLLDVVLSGQIPSRSSLSPFIQAGLLLMRHASSLEMARQLMSSVSRGTVGANEFEGMCYLDFLRAVPDHLQVHGAQGESLYLSSIPVWGPRLLGNKSSEVANDTLDVIRHALRLGDEGVPAESDPEKQRLIFRTARKLEMNCLEFLKHTYLDSGSSPTRRSMIPFESTMAYCGILGENYTGLSEEEAAALIGMRQDMLEYLRNNTVEDQDDVGSDISQGSCATDDIGDFQEP